MMRFILASFGFLALTFYELSGGADFDPVTARDAAVLARVDLKDASQTTDIKTARTGTTIERPEDTHTVTRVALNLTTFDDAANQAQEKLPQTAILSKPLEETDKTEPLGSENAFKTSVAAFDSTPDANGVLPSIIFSGSRSQASSNAVGVRRDIRFVSAETVNMRGGPGTGFEVISRLDLNTEVEVLQDDGTGWVKLRPVTGEPDGWIADYLLTNG